MYKVFVNESSLQFVAEHRTDTYSYRNSTQLWQLFEALEKTSRAREIYVYHSDPQKGWEEFQSQFKVIEAAGGVVTNPSGEVLLIYRLGTWDLPKGKLNENEEPEEGAIREVREECGIPAPAILEKLPDTFHTYRLKGKPVLKRTFWFSMKLESNAPLTPQHDEDITEAIWCPLPEAKEKLNTSYSSLREMFRQFLEQHRNPLGSN